MKQQREWCAYVRVSRVGGRSGDSFHSPDQQEQEVRRTSSGPVVAVFTDLDVSGGKFERVGLDAALAWAREAPDLRGIGVYDIDRLGRDMVESLILVRKLSDDGVPVEVRGEEVETRTSNGVLRWGIPMTIAESQLRKAGERWTSVQQRRIERGQPKNGNLRLGYLRETDGRFVPNPETAPALRDAYLSYIDGRGLLAITRDLRERGVTSTRGNTISLASLRNALASGFAAGLICNGDRSEFTEGTHEAIVTRDEWSAYLRARDTAATQHPKVRAAKWWLSSVVYCGACGSRMGVNSYTSPKSLALCSNYKNGLGCTGGSIPRWSIERSVALWVGGHIDELTSQARDAERGGERAEMDAQRLRLIGEVAAKEKALGRLGVLLATEALDPVSHREARLQVDADLADLRARLAGVHDRLAALRPVDLDAYERLAQVEAGPEWNALLRRVLARVEVYPDSLVFRPVVGEVKVAQRLRRAPGRPARAREYATDTAG